MKSITTSLSIVAATFIYAGGIHNAHALPSWKQGPPLHFKEKKELANKNNEKGLFMVCKDSKGIILVPVKNRKEAIDICKSGTLWKDHECRTRHRIHWHNPNHRQGTQHRVMTMVDAEGQPCLTLARIK